MNTAAMKENIMPATDQQKNPTSSPVSIIDSHSYLWASDYDSLGCGIGKYDVLREEHSVDQYHQAISQCLPDVDLRGFIVFEPNRPACVMGIHNDCIGWDAPLKDIRFFSQVALGTSSSSEHGHTVRNPNLCLAVIPWIPFSAGEDIVKQYIKLAKQAAGNGWSRVKGFSFIPSRDRQLSRCTSWQTLEYLGKEGYTFDTRFDVRQEGCKDGKDLIDLLYKLYGGLDLHHGCDEVKYSPTFCHNGTATLPSPGTPAKANVVIAHMGHPEMGATAGTNAEAFTVMNWRNCIAFISHFPGTYVKLSGGFADLPSQTEERPKSAKLLYKRIKPFLDHVFDCYGPDRIMFGSEWPICEVDGPGKNAWKNWQELIALYMRKRGLSEDDTKKVWHGTAAKVYRLDL